MTDMRRSTIGIYVIIGLIVGAAFGLTEYFIRLNTDDQQALVPLLIRAMICAPLIFVTIVSFSSRYEKRFAHKTFLYLVVVKSVFYTLSTTAWLLLTNGIWYAVNGGIPFYEELILYLKDEMYLINLGSIFVVVTGIVSVVQINSLHKKGELLNFILGRYHKPREVERIFCFIDLKGSTTIAEKLGHLEFANFLKDYYSDITDALRNSKAQVYQYVGDEIVLSWSFEKGLENNNAVHCFFEMKRVIQGFKAEVHGQVRCLS